MPYYSVYMWRKVSDEVAGTKYTVSFNTNGGSIYSGSSTKTIVAGESLGELPYVSKTDSHFIGWYTAANGGTKIEDGHIFTEAKNMTLYAHWENFLKTGHDYVYRMIGSPTGTGSDYSTDVADVGANANKTGANVAMYYKNTWDGAEGDNFVRFIDAGNGYVYIQPINSSKVYDVSGGTIANGRNVQLYDLNYTNAQKWKIKKIDGYKNHYVFLSALNENYCLERDGSGSIYAGQNIQTWTYDNLISQSWLLDDVATSSAYTTLREWADNPGTYYGDYVQMDGWYMQASETKTIKIYVDGKYYGKGWNTHRNDVIDAYPYHTGGADYNYNCGWHAKVSTLGLESGTHTITLKIYDNFNQYLNYSKSYTFNVPA